MTYYIRSAVGISKFRNSTLLLLKMYFVQSFCQENGSKKSLKTQHEGCLWGHFVYFIFKGANNSEVVIAFFSTDFFTHWMLQSLHYQGRKNNHFSLCYKSRLTLYCSVICSSSSTTFDTSKSTPIEASAQQQ